MRRILQRRTLQRHILQRRTVQRRILQMIALPSMALLCVLAGSGCRLLDELLHTTPPHVVARRPGGDIVAPFDEVEIEFSAPMRRAQTEESFGMEINGLKIEGAFRWRDDERSFRFVPDYELLLGDQVRVYVRPAAEDRWGNSLRDEYATEFMINVAGPAPQLEGHSPADNERAVALRHVLELHFPQPIDPDSLYASLTIQPDVRGSYVWNSDYTSVRFMPLEDYRPDQLYRVSLNGRLRAQAGTVAVVDEQFAFVTVAHPMAEVMAVSIANRIEDATEGAIEGVIEGVEADRIDLDATDVLALNAVGAERQIDIVARFSTPIEDSQQADILRIAPAVPFDLTWNTDGLKMRATPLVPLEWNQIYEISLLERRYRFIVDGDHSRPPTLIEALFDADRSDADGFVALQEAANIQFPDSSDAAVRLYFELAAGATVDMASFGESMRLNSAEGIFSFVVRDIEVGVAPDGRPFAQALLRVARNGTPPDIVTLSIGEQLHDSLGNRLREAIRISVNGL